MRLFTINLQCLNGVCSVLARAVSVLMCCFARADGFWLLSAPVNLALTIDAIRC